MPCSALVSRGLKMALKMQTFAHLLSIGLVGLKAYNLIEALPKHTEMLNIQMHDNELRAFFWSPRLPPTLSLTSKLL